MMYFVSRKYGKATNDESRYDALVVTKHRLKDERAALNTLLRTLDDCMSEVQQSLDDLPRFAWQRSLRNIPNEILAIIFDHPPRDRSARDVR